MTLSIHCIPLNEVPSHLQRHKRLAALDIGKNSFGLAIATSDGSLVTPLGTVKRNKWAVDLAALEKSFKGFEIAALIVGLPLNMDGSEGPQAQSVRQTVTNLIAAQPKWLMGAGIAFIDERLSTSEAHDLLEDRFSRVKAKQSGALDAMAAVRILQRAVESFTSLCHSNSNS